MVRIGASRKAATSGNIPLPLRRSRRLDGHSPEYKGLDDVKDRNEDVPTLVDTTAIEAEADIADAFAHLLIDENIAAQPTGEQMYLHLVSILDARVSGLADDYFYFADERAGAWVAINNEMKLVIGDKAFNNAVKPSSLFARPDDTA